MKYFIAALLFIPGNLLAQIELSFSSGIGTYKMADMKSFQKELQSQFPVEAKITESFPSYWQYEGSIKMTFENNVIIGGSLSYGSTGGRISYGDYSGMLSVDQLLEAYYFSSIVGTSQKFDRGALILSATANIGTTLTKLQVMSNNIINHEQTLESYGFKSYNLVVQPTLSLTRRFWFTGVSLNLGYNQTVVPGKLKSQDYNDAHLTNQNDKPLHADWSGLRLTGGVLFYFHRFTPEEK